jgi:hypothetical protein
VVSTRAKLTVAFVAGMIAVAVTLFLAVLTARNNAVYHDIAQYAAAQGDLAARVITDAAQSGDKLLASGDTALIPVLTPKLVARLQIAPGYIVVVDTAASRARTCRHCRRSSRICRNQERL